MNWPKFLGAGQTPQSISNDLNTKALTGEEISEKLHANMFFYPETQITSYVIPHQLALLNREAKVYSARSLGRKCQQLHGRILEEAAKQGIPSQNVYYLVPKEYKSYGMMAGVPPLLWANQK